MWKSSTIARLGGAAALTTLIAAANTMAQPYG
jgi:hypothetical protein